MKYILSNCQQPSAQCSYPSPAHPTLQRRHRTPSLLAVCHVYIPALNKRELRLPQISRNGTDEHWLRRYLPRTVGSFHLETPQTEQTRREEQISHFKTVAKDLLVTCAHTNAGLLLAATLNRARLPKKFRALDCHFAPLGPVILKSRDWFRLLQVGYVSLFWL